MRKIQVTNEVIEQLCKRYSEGVGRRKLADEFGLSSSVVIRLLKEKGVSMHTQPREYTFDEEYFSVIDTEQKAYWLGFIFADGCVFKNSLKIRLAEKDVSVLRKVLEGIGHSNPNKSIKFGYQNSFGVMKPYVTVDINSKKLVSDLCTLGCTPKKSATLKFPTEHQVPRELQHHFIRGYMDGDGSISITNGKCKAIHVGFDGSKEFLETLKDVLGLNIPVRAYKDKGGYVLRFGGSIQVREKLDYIYKDATIFLERKHAHYTKFFNL